MAPLIGLSRLDTMWRLDLIGQVNHDRMDGGLDWLRSGRLATKGRIVHDCIWWIGDDGLGWLNERAGHDGIERHGHDQVGWSRWGGLATIGWGDLATKGRFGYDVAGWPRLGRLVAIGLRELAMTGWVGHVGVGWHMMELFHLMEFHLESLSYWTKLVVPCWCAFLVQHRRWIIRLMEFQLEFP